MTLKSLPKVSNTEFAGIPIGLYVCTLSDMEEWESNSQSQFEDSGPQVKWVFTIEQVIDCDEEVDEDALVGKDIWGFSSYTMGKKAKMRAWAEQILGRQLEENEELDPTDLIGQRCKVNMAPHTKRDGTETTKIGSIVSYRAKRANGNGKPAAKAQTEDGLPF